MSKMLRFEIKKIFSKTKNRITVIALLVILIAISILTINRVEYVDENGNHSTGILAARNLREAKNEWSGYLTEDTFRKALEKNREINNSKEALSDDEVGTIYERRISTLKEWLDSGEESFTDEEKNFLIQHYETLKTPFYYEYADG